MSPFLVLAFVVVIIGFVLLLRPELLWRLWHRTKKRSYLVHRQRCCAWAASAACFCQSVWHSWFNTGEEL